MNSGFNRPRGRGCHRGASSMGWGHVLRSRSLRPRLLCSPLSAAVGLLAIVTVAGLVSDQAEAKARAKAKSSHRAQSHHRAIHGPDYRPPYADIVVDDNSGEVLHGVSSDEPRHPASLTKIMTLYLLFEQLEAGKLKLDTPLPISPFAAGQHP